MVSEDPRDAEIETLRRERDDALASARAWKRVADEADPDQQQKRAAVVDWLENHQDKMVRDLSDLNGRMEGEIENLTRNLTAAQEERDGLRSLIDSPEIHDFARAVVVEAAHQRKRWGAEHDKTDADWFWLIGYLAGKALHTPGADPEKLLHRIITVAAAACNWHAQRLGKTNMRPGIEPPASEES